MKSRLLLFFLLLLTITSFAQTNTENLKGSVSYMSSQNIYVRFENTDGIHVGDTLYIVQNEIKTPALVVKSLSSISCVGSAMGSVSLSVATPLIAKKRVENKPVENNEESKYANAVNDKAINAAFKNKKEKETRERFDGRLSVNSYTNLSDIYPTNERLRYNLSINAEHIGNSNLSAETYISFTHLLNQTIVLNNALKVYTLGLKYDLSKTATINFGRKIYNNMANIGAVDGLEFEKVSHDFTFGALVGSRPDFLDYSFNPNLLQYGAFVSHSIKNDNGYMQTSLAVFNQMNNFKTDRRFAYFQHSNSLLKNVDLFSSFEFDLYGIVNNQLASTFNLTSTYISLRYRPWKELSLSVSYDARKNIYYFETFKMNKLDSIYDKETRQGARFQAFYRPFKNFVWGGNVGYRSPEMRDTTHTPALNGYTYLTYTQVPFINASATISATTLTSYYIKNMTVYEISLMKDFFNGNVNLEVEYRLGNYQYKNSALVTQQNIAAMSLFWRIAKKTSISANVEATFENTNNYASLYLTINQRF